MRAPKVVAFVLCSIYACGQDHVQRQDASAHLPLPAAVDAVLAARCRKCHSDPPREFVPFALVSWDDTQARAPGHDGARIYEVIAVRIHDASFPMPPSGNPMTDADRDVLDDWIAQGAKPGE